MSTAGPRILFVDDDESIRNIISFSLEQEGFQVVMASDGEQGLQAARAEPPNVIVLDIMLPTLNGHEVLRRLKADTTTKGIPVIMVSGRHSEPEEQESMRLGAVGHIEKPYEFDELLKSVKAVLSDRSPQTP